jgi:precorrin isomerase
MASINKVRRSLYKAARILGDVNAVKRGTVGKRLARRAVGRATGRGMGRMFK